MNAPPLVGYGLLAAVLVFYGYRWIRVLRVRLRLPALRQEGATIVDVRTAAEFAAGHAGGTRNIPLDELVARSGELDPERWVVLCCASGTRSAMAARLLRGRGFRKVANAGSWRNVAA